MPYLIIGGVLLAGLLIWLIPMIVGGVRIYENTNQMCTNERTSDERLTEWLTGDMDFDIEAFEATYRIEHVELTSGVDGHTIPASYIYAPGSEDMSGDTVVMVHGLLGNRLSNYPVAQMFLGQGINVLTYDQRSSGGNTAQHTTFGVLESRDTVDCCAWLLERMEAYSLLGLWGQSLGGATVQNTLDDPIVSANVDFFVLDCPMGNMEELLPGGKGEVFFADMLTRINVGYSFEQQRVYPRLEHTAIPAMVVCSDGDDSFPNNNEQRIFDAIASENKVMYRATDSAHSMIYHDHPDEYTARLTAFIDSLR